MHLLRIGVLLFFMAAASAAAQQPDGGSPAGNGPDRSEARVPVLETAVLPTNESDQVWITNRSYRQIFEPYLFPQGPVFVTGDAVLQAFHVLLAQSVDRFEQAGAACLQQALRLMRRQGAAKQQEAETADSGRAAGSPEGRAGGPETADSGYQGLRQRARLRARIVIAVAQQLIGEDEPALDPDIAAIVETEVRRVAEADGVHLPEWFGAADDLFDGIDYSVFRPHGYYRQSETLKRYFRTVRWLQSIPFRVDSDEELLAILLLSGALTSTQRADSDARRTAENYLRCFRDLFGRKDDRDLLFAAAILKDRPADLDTVRQHLQSVDGMPAEEIQHWNPDPHRAALFIISPSRLPDEQFFQRRQESENLIYADPSGLEISALLGSGYARSQLDLRLPVAYRQFLQAEIERFGMEMASDGLYTQYLRAVAALLDPPEPDAPAFTRGTAWKAKSCNAALAGWVLMRKLLPVNRSPAGEAIEEVFTEVPAGFVEPDPEFFDRLGELSRRAANIFDRCSALPEPAAQFAAWLRQFERLLAEDRFPGGSDDAQALSSQEREAVEKSLAILSTLEDRRADAATGAGRKDLLRKAAADVAESLIRGEYDQDPAYQALVIESGLDLKQRWQQLHAICRRLEVMAHKQLRKVAFNEKETYFLNDFGFALAAVMLYGGDSYRRPRDDAPAAFTYFFDPRSKKHLHAAVARPREIIVAYPTDGRYLICRGAVLPYYEFIATTDLSDELWRRRLDSDERPSPLRWLDPVMQSGDPVKSWRRIGTPKQGATPAVQ